MSQARFCGPCGNFGLSLVVAKVSSSERRPISDALGIMHCSFLKPMFFISPCRFYIQFSYLLRDWVWLLPNLGCCGCTLPSSGKLLCFHCYFMLLCSHVVVIRNNGSNCLTRPTLTKQPPGTEVYQSRLLPTLVSFQTNYFPISEF